MKTIRNLKDGKWALLLLLSIFIFTKGLGQTCKSNPTPAKMPIGAELEPFWFYSFSNAFVDVVKQLDKFSPANPADSVNFLDANGWPTHDFGFMMFAYVDSSSLSLNGTYKISFNGKANVTSQIGSPEYKISNQYYYSSTNTTLVDLTIDGTLVAGPGPSMCTLTFSNTQRSQSAAYNTGITNLKILRPSYDSTNQTFTNEFINHLKRFNVLRFKEWQKTDDSPVINWSDRTLPTDPSQCYDRGYFDYRGVAWEYCIELANLVNADMWVNIPHKASDDYVKQLSTLLKNKLNSNLNIYLEYSNDLWLPYRQQYQWNLDATKAEISGTSNLQVPFEPDTSRMADRRIARRSIEITKIFESTFGSAAINNRIRPVISFNPGNPEFVNRVFDWVDSTYKKPASSFFYAAATTLRFDLKGNDVTGYSSGRILDTLQAGLNDLFGSHFNMSNLMVAASNAAYYNVKLFCNKGGYNVDGNTNVNSKIAALKDLRMMDMIDSYLNQWFSYGYNQLIWYYAGAHSWKYTYEFSSITDDIKNPYTPALYAMDAIDTIISNHNLKITKGHILSTSSTTSIDARLYSNYYTTYKEYIGSYPVDYTSNPYLNKIYGTSFNDYLVNSPVPGSYSFRANLNCHGPGVKLKIAVNNILMDSLKIPIDSGFVDSPSILLKLNQGLNTIRIFYDFVPNYYLDIKFLTFDFQGPCNVVPLPVRFLDFELEVTDEANVDIKWMTVNEKKASHFIIERSKLSNKSFVKVDSVDANNLSVGSYEIIDHNPEQGMNFYRIKEVDQDNTYSYTGVKAVDLAPIKLTLAGPNPTHGEIFYKLVTPTDKTVVVVVTDPLGQIINQKHLKLTKGANNDHIHISPSHQGIYVLRVIEEDGSNSTALRLVI